MNNNTNRSTPAAASPLTAKEAAPPALVKTIGGTTFDILILSILVDTFFTRI